jgi:exodeoxyribonuclease VII large subunit
MARTQKSQWEFGELFPAEAVRKVLSVSELTGSIRRTLEKEFGTVSVMGEITNLRVQASGHIYFSIKDASAQLSCVLFRNESRTVNREYLQDGQKVIIEGEVTVYEARGQYQLRVLSMQLEGIGALQAAFERLKQKLHAEGLFDQGHKRPLPHYPRAVGLVTSPVGAAIHDLLHGIQRRNPALSVVLAGCRVQGPGAAQEIAAAIHLLNDWALSNGEPKIDLILVARGGGSLEDLWAFNEEMVARAIYASRLPVLSAVGHEIDFTISDFVADFRAATPTAAAEIITEGVFSARPYIFEARNRLRDLLAYAFGEKREVFSAFGRRLARLHPQRRLAEQSQRIDDLHESLNRCARHHLHRKQTGWQAAQLRLTRVRPDALIERRRERLIQLKGRLKTEAAAKFQAWRERMARTTARLRLLSPQNVLDRGYSITTDLKTGKVVRDPSQVKQGDQIATQIQKGEIISVVSKGNSGSKRQRSVGV